MRTTITDTTTDSITYVRGRSANWLAREVECGIPDSRESPGADYLTHIARNVVDAFEWAISETEITDPRTGLDPYMYCEFRDGMQDLTEPTVYTHKLWQIFVDLQAYEVDMGDLYGSEFPTDSLGFDYPTQALMIIGERLAIALWEYLVGALADDLDAQADAAALLADYEGE